MMNSWEKIWKKRVPKYNTYHGGWWMLLINPYESTQARNV